MPEAILSVNDIGCGGTPAGGPCSPADAAAVEGNRPGKTGRMTVRRASSPGNPTAEGSSDCFGPFIVPFYDP